MPRELLQTGSHREFIRKKIVPNALRSVALAGGLSLLLAVSNDSAQASNNYHDVRTSSIKTTEVYANSQIEISPISTKAEQTKSKNEIISNTLDNNYARSGLAALLGMALSMTVSAHILGKKYDESKLHILRVAGPLVMTTSVSSSIIDSFKTIDANIPAGLFVASTVLIGSYQIINTFQHHKDRNIRALAVSTAATLSSIGAIALLALNR